MSSPSPPPLPPKGLGPFDQPLVPVNVDRYREVVYHDGRGRFTTDSHRRPRTMSWVESTPVFHPSCGSRLSDQSVLPLRNQTSTLETSHTAHLSRTVVPLRGQHVTVAKYTPKPRPKVIVEPQKRRSEPKNTSESFQIFNESQGPHRQYWTEVSTPPSTPRPRRLSTPELSDIEDRPFCYCDSQKNVVMYCTSCRRQVDPLA